MRGRKEKTRKLPSEEYPSSLVRQSSYRWDECQLSKHSIEAAKLQATNRLAHLNLEGFERFVGSTIDRALAGARTKSSDPLESREAADEQSEEAVYLQHEVEHDTDMYVSKEADVRRTSCGDCKSKVRPVCESCLRSGESSCSSALSSLESVKSSQSGAGVPRSRESDSSARGSYLSSGNLFRIHLVRPSNQNLSQQIRRLTWLPPTPRTSLVRST